MHQGIEGITAFSPWPPRRFDLIHAFNRIPLGHAPFVIGFESHMPRGFGLETSHYYGVLSRMLASPRCRGIIAISNYAREIFKETHQNSAMRDILYGKLSVRYPNIEIPAEAARPEPVGRAPFVVSFVGNHFARKGGCVAVRMAELALQKKLPVQVEIVSSLQVGRGVWTDPLNDHFYDRYRAALKLPNVRWHATLSNVEVHALFRRSHVSLLATFCDTFGYSAIESMIHGTPVLATRQGALPEFIVHRQNGLLLDLDTAPNGEWIHIAHPDRGSRAYESLVEGEIERMAQVAILEIERLIERPDELYDMRRHARSDAERLFGAQEANAYWDGLYERALTAQEVGDARFRLEAR
ncbi:glycosyltransferase family 4 protein [Methylobacterium sp. UNC378MF]|uniref:glycosyltransferase family 4 protein n=1 Tax=Methylobacterium sp. UNC378MF TaxID=1502748 RepID=UPI000B8297B7|nr:glycosyltransferase family 4 protein [Methylobacterium sp. UNC378MF]